MPATQKPAWLITGCSTGFGRELAQQLLAKGYRVAATARDAASLPALGQPSDSFLPLSLDVTKPEQVKQAIEATQQQFGGIDVLVNNAGYGYLAAIEEGEEDEVRAMFETNVFGLIAMTKAALPGMRARKTGTIVNISSVGGLVGFPSSGYYAATKFAVEGLSESLSKEVEPLGLKVLLVEPGPFRTDWAGRSLKQAKTAIQAYAETAGARRQQIAGYSGNQPGDPARGALAIIKAVEARTPPLRLVLGAMGLENARNKVKSLTRDFDAWEETTLGADYPQEEKAA